MKKSSDKDKRTCRKAGKKDKKKNNSKRRHKAAFFTVLTLVLISAVICLASERISLTFKKYDLGDALICIDAGHGFADPGAQNENLGDLDEASINYSISKKLAEKLEALGFSVVLTHDSESIPEGYDIDGDMVFDPSERVKYSDELSVRPDIFISIHCDSFVTNEEVKGTRIYYQIGKESSIVNGLLSSISSEIDSIDESRRKTILKPMTAEDAYTVICNRAIPVSFLVECGFITNPDDAAILCDPTWQTEFADAVANGIHKYLK